VPRQPRFFVPGLPQHAIVRGIDRQSVFLSPDDYALYLESLKKSAKRYDCAVHAYVLMTNHVHLLVTPGSKNALPLFFQAMGRYYVQEFNRLHDRVGALWQGRYKTSLVQDDLYLMTCYRYIELNPVRAGNVGHPSDYPYSSYGFNALGKRDELVMPHRVYASLSRNPEERRALYRKMFDDQISTETLDTIRDSANACRILGNEQFKNRVACKLGVRVRRKKPGRPKKALGENERKTTA
jgi:putative transposase